MSRVVTIPYAVGGAPYIVNGASIALGTTSGAATAAGTRAIAIGTSSSASNTDSIAIGRSVTASGVNTIAIGCRGGTVTSGANTVNLGGHPNATTVTASNAVKIDGSGQWASNYNPGATNVVSIDSNLSSTSINTTAVGANGGGFGNFMSNSVLLGTTRGGFFLAKNKDTVFCPDNLGGLAGNLPGGVQWSQYTHANNPYTISQGTFVGHQGFNASGIQNNSTTLVYRWNFPVAHIEHSNVVIGFRPKLTADTVTSGQLGTIRTFSLNFGTTGNDTSTLRSDFVPNGTAAVADPLTTKMLLVELGGVAYKIPLYV